MGDGANNSDSGDQNSMAAGVAAIAASMERSRRDQERQRRGAVWGAWIWRGVVFAFILLAVLGSAVNEAPVLGDQIARYTVEGVITDDPDRDALLSKIAEEDKVKALIVRVNSPGGTTTGGEALYDSLRKVAEKKPVVAVMGEVAASAGYITAISADHVVARGNSITASIGVIFTAPNFHKLLDNVGVSVVELKSGDRKAEPSPYKPIDLSKLELERELIADSFNWFLDLVKERRNPNQAVLNMISDGRILLGRQALDAGLVDQIGGESDAIAWLEKEKKIANTLPVVERKVKKPEQGLAGLVGGMLGLDFGKALGGGDYSALLQRLLGGPTLMSVVD